MVCKYCKEKKANKAAYYSEVVGTGKDTLIVYGEDKKPDKEATWKSLNVESERLAAIVVKQGSSSEVTKDCNGHLEAARKGLQEGKDSGNVLKELEAVKQRLLRAYDSREAFHWYFLFALWNGVLLAGFFVVIFWWKDLVPGKNNLTDTWYVLWACVLWGGMGGIVDALLAIQKHSSKQDFDLRYWAWHLLHPALACSLGAIVFLLMQASLLSLTGMSLKEEPSGAVQTGGSAALPLALAFLAGFKQNTMQALLIRVINSIFNTEAAKPDTQG